MDEDYVTGAETRAQVRQALAQLGEPHRVPLVMRQYGHMSYDHIALSLGTTPALARNRVHYALRKLAPLLVSSLRKEAVLMTCAECRELIPEFIYGALAEGERQGLEAHLSACSACKLEHQALATTVGMLTSQEGAFRQTQLRCLKRDGEVLYVTGSGTTAPGMRYHSMIGDKSGGDLLWVRDGEGMRLPFTREDWPERPTTVWLYTIDYGRELGEGELAKTMSCWVSHENPTSALADGREEFSVNHTPIPECVFELVPKVEGTVSDIECDPPPVRTDVARGFTLLSWVRHLDYMEAFRCRVAFRR